MDRDLGSRIVPAILKEAGLNVETHADHFPHDAPDTEWLREIGNRGWILLSRDRKMRRVTAERDCIMESGLRVFYLVGRHEFSALARNFVRLLPRIHRMLRRNRDPFIAHVRMDARDPSRPGSVRIMLRFDDWKQSRNS